MATLLYWPILDVDVESLPDPSSTQMANQNDHLYYELEQLIKDLTVIQQRRLYMKYYLEMSNVEIAEVEQVSYSAVRKSIDQSIIYIRRKMHKFIHWFVPYFYLRRNSIMSLSRERRIIKYGKTSWKRNYDRKRIR